MSSRVPEPYTRLETYPWRCMIPTRFGDQDPNLHINNVAMTGLFQESRAQFTTMLDPVRGMRAGATVAASLKIDFLAEAFYPTNLTMTVGFLRIGRTSWTLIEAAFDGDRCLSVCEAVIVGMRDGRPSAIPDAWRETAQTYLMKLD